MGKPLIDILTTASVGVVDEWAEKMKDNLDKKTEEKMREKDPTGPADTEDGWMQYFEAVDAEIDKAKSATSGSSGTNVARLVRKTKNRCRTRDVRSPRSPPSILLSGRRSTLPWYDDALLCRALPAQERRTS